MEEMNMNLSNINLLNFFEFMGETILKHGNSAFKLLDYDSLIISKSNPSTYFRFSTGRGGNVLTACTEIYSMSKIEAMEKIKEFIEKINNNEFIPTNEINYEKTEKNINYKNVEIKNNKKIMEDYLINKRGLDKNTVEYLIKKNYITTDSKGNIAFRITDSNGNYKGFDLCGTKSKFKMNTSDNYGFNIRKNNNKVNNLFVFESCIDLISYLEIINKDEKRSKESIEYIKENDNTMLLSLSGLKEVVLNKYVKDVEKLFVCTDNDFAGNSFYKKIKEKYKDENVEIIRIKPKEKDFNDDLIALKKLKIPIQIER